MEELEIVLEPEDVVILDSYENLGDKPSINGVELVGNKTLEELGIEKYDDTDIKEELNNKQPKGNYALKSEIPDVSSFITASVDNLENYFKKEDIEKKIGDIDSILATLTTPSVGGES